MPEDFIIRTMLNGADWYWEVVTQERHVIARGRAETQNKAEAAAEVAAEQDRALQAFQSDYPS
jgi:hypothetical protein